MLFNLANGRTIEISIEQFLEMTDEDLELLNASGYGDQINDPFFGSAISGYPPERIIYDLTELSSEDKLQDLDLDNSTSGEE